MYSYLRSLQNFRNRKLQIFTKERLCVAMTVSGTFMVKRVLKITKMLQVIFNISFLILVLRFQCALRVRNNQFVNCCIVKIAAQNPLQRYSTSADTVNAPIAKNILLTTTSVSYSPISFWTRLPMKMLVKMIAKADAL